MPAAGVQTSSAAFASQNSIEKPIRKQLTLGTAETILSVPAGGSAGSNAKKVLYLRAAVESAAGTPNLTLDILGSDGSTVYVLRSASALSAGEVYREVDILLQPGETLRGTCSTGNISVTGQYLDIGRGNNG